MRRCLLLPFLFGLSLLGAIGIVSPGLAVFTGTRSFPPIATSTAAPNRQALIVVPAFSGGGSNLRGAVAHADAEAYRKLLQQLGFAVTIVVADTRPSLDLAARNFAGALRPDADVAVFVLGSVIGADRKLFIPASDLSDLERRPDQIAFEGLNLAEVLQKIRDRGPRELVAIIDECGAGESNPTCDIGSGTLPDGVSAIVAKRLARNPGGEPLAGVASLRVELLPLMREPDMSFLNLYKRLKGKLEGSNVGLVTTPALSRNFSFLPGDFLQKLPTECNKVDSAMSAETLRGMPEVTPLISACERAAQEWSFASYFKEKLATAREQLALQKALAGCEGDAAQVYLDTYREGAYRFAVSDQVDKCARLKQPRPAPPPPPPEPPPAPPPPAPAPSVSRGPSLQDRAFAAVVTFYDRHNYTAGDDLDGLASLYPEMFNFKGSPRSGQKQVRELRGFYSKLLNFHIAVVPGSLDFSGCTDADSCLVRGMAQASFRKLYDSSSKYSLSRFSLRFDLNPPVRVLYECAVPASGNREPPCD